MTEQFELSCEFQHLISISRFSYLIGSPKYRVSTYLGQFQVMFKSQDFFPIILKQQLTTLDFVSYCGGSLGLFLGFSALSAVEIIYYFSMRIVFAKKREKKISNSVQRNPNKTQNYLIDFAESSTVHGFNQVVAEMRHTIER